MDTVREGLLVLDARLVVTSANRSFLSMFDVDPERTIGRPVFELGDGQWDIPDLRRLLEEVLPSEATVEGFKVDHVFPGVGRRIVRLNARKVFRAGNHVESLLVAFEDVTDARLLEMAAVRNLTLARSIVDTVRDPLVVLDGDLRITMASRNFVRIFGLAEADLVGKLIEEIGQGQWDVEALRGVLRRVVPDALPVDGFLVEDEFPGLGHRVFKLNARKVFVPGNNVTSLLLAFEDVTSAVAVDRHRDVLAAELAHRIKNSLSVISSFVSFELRRASEPCVDGYRAMQTRINAVAQLYDVIAKSSALGPVAVQGYLEGIASSVRVSLLGGQTDIAIVVEAEPLEIVPDHAVSIGLLVNELATNAVKYAFPEGKVQIRHGFLKCGEEVLLSVEDDGVGYEASARSAKHGSGMGSRFVDAFVQQLDGTLVRDSGPEGTAVTVRLPGSVLV